MSEHRNTTVAKATEATGVVPREVCVLRYALEKHARERPDELYAVFESGERWSWQATLNHARETAAALQSLGVGRGDTVLVMMPNSADGLRCLFGINHLGAICVPVNPALTGRLLEHVLRNCGARLAIVHRQALGSFAGIDNAGLRTIVVMGSAGAEENPAAGTTHACGAGDRREIEIIGANRLRGDPSHLAEVAEPIEPWDTQSIIYTSGTTGPSKGVLSSYMHSWSAMGPEAWHHVRDDDRHLIHMPLFHIGGAFICFMAATRGGSIAMVSGFRTESFWETVTRLEVSAVFLLGAMATFLMKQEPGPWDRAHRLRLVFIVPLGGLSEQFRQRFGVDVCTIFNMTEISTPLRSALNPSKPQVCGRPRPGVTLRLVDENDCEVPPGTPGELIIRTERPWAMNHGYHANPDATAKAWRNGWFHTGDVFVVDEEGDYFFVDRRKDMIRRRGENISAQELEAEAIRHQAIREAAAIGIPSELSEDEVMLVVSLQPGATLAPVDLLDFLRDLVPHFMLPRYLRIVDSLPLTPTAKVLKQTLREEGLAPGTWDREAAGIRVRARRFD